MPVPDNIMDVFKIPYYVKEMTIKFPNGDHSDILPEQIVGESLNLTESICSNSDFIFGVAEKNVFEINVVGLDNIKGKVIEPEVSCTINDVTPPQTVTTKLGRFVVDECEIENYAGSAVQRKITAYSDIDLSEGNIYERWKDEERSDNIADDLKLENFMEISHEAYANIHNYDEFAEVTGLDENGKATTKYGREITEKIITDTTLESSYGGVYTQIAVNNSTQTAYYLRFGRMPGVEWGDYSFDLWRDPYSTSDRSNLSFPGYIIENKDTMMSEINEVFNAVKQYYSYSEDVPLLNKILDYITYYYIPTPVKLSGDSDRSRKAFDGYLDDYKLEKLPEYSKIWKDGCNVLPLFASNKYGSSYIKNASWQGSRHIDSPNPSGYATFSIVKFTGDHYLAPSDSNPNQETVYEKKLADKQYVKFVRIRKFVNSVDIFDRTSYSTSLNLGSMGYPDFSAYARDDKTKFLNNVMIEEILPLMYHSSKFGNPANIDILYKNIDNIGDYICGLSELGGIFWYTDRNGCLKRYFVNEDPSTKTLLENEYNSATHSEQYAKYSSIEFKVTDNWTEKISVGDRANRHQETKFEMPAFSGGYTLVGGSSWGSSAQNYSYNKTDVIKGRIRVATKSGQGQLRGINYSDITLSSQGIDSALLNLYKDRFVYIGQDGWEAFIRPCVFGSGGSLIPLTIHINHHEEWTRGLDVIYEGDYSETIDPNTNYVYNYDITENNFMKLLGDDVGQAISYAADFACIMATRLSYYNDYLNNLSINIPNGGGDPLLPLGTKLNVHINNEQYKAIIERRTLSGLRAVSDSIECYGLEGDTSSSGYSSGGSQGGGGGGYTPVPTPVDVNNSRITIEQGNFSDSFTLNQDTDKTITLPDSGAANDGALTIKQGGTTLGTFTANQSNDADIDIPEPSNATVTINQGNFSGSFSLNQNNNQTINLPDAEIPDYDERIEAIEDRMPTFTSPNDKLAKESALELLQSSLEFDINSINNKIPQEATIVNKLTDNLLVTNMISNNASSFRGVWETWLNVPSSLEASPTYPTDNYGSIKPTLNDYMIVKDARHDESYSGTWLFIYSGDWDTYGKNGWYPKAKLTSVIPNPTEVTHATLLNMVKIDGEIYELAQVTANPGGASQDLTSIDINGTKYNISGGGGGGGTSTLELLWTNPNPSSNFSAQTVSLDLTNYDLIVIESSTTTTSSRLFMTLCRNGTAAQLQRIGTNYLYIRSLDITNAGVSFETGQRIQALSGTWASNSGYIIPQKIYGVHKITGANNFIDLVGNISNDTAMITDSTIGTATDFQFFTDAPGQAPTGVNVSGNTMTISFNNTTATQVKARCWL